ncbi:MAG: protein translocase subunit SecD [Rhodothermaceae bacterium]|nr:protein translocase subunit SecD [Rhodothermaceae bacterium]
MKDNGFKIFLTVAFILLCGYELFPSIQGMFIQSRLDELQGEELDTYREENANLLRNVDEESLKLGLDLMGGMHVTLEVRLDALIAELANDKDDTFEEVLRQAREEAVSGTESMIDAFADAFSERDPNALLSRYFRDDDADITRRSTNDEVIEYLRVEADEAVLRAIEIIRQRVDRFGVTEPSIQRQGTRRIVVELPGIFDQNAEDPNATDRDTERVNKLLQGTARLEFRLMSEPNALQLALQEAFQVYEEEFVAADDSTDQESIIAEGDSALTDEQLAEGIESLLGDQEQTSTNKLRDVLIPIGGTSFGYVAATDTAAFNEIMREAVFQQLLPINTKLMYSAAPRVAEGEELFEVLGIIDEIALDGGVITDARVDYTELNQPKVSMEMNSDGSRAWAQITGANVGKQVAVVMDNVVYSNPVINERISGGRTEITGLDSREEAQDIVNVLKSGALPAPVDIVEQRTVGPSLGAASIQAGLNSVLVGLLLVALFMILYYRTAGIVADIALIINIIFIFGILAGFSATLTLPGIAGIVLTIGMAVDANVLIFERVREERSTGKTLKAAIDGGYSKALSAIFDANITTFFVGAILYSFGVGPIKGFAVTLMAGILASMFSAIIITRLIIDYMVIDRRMSVSYG